MATPSDAVRHTLMFADDAAATAAMPLFTPLDTLILMPPCRYCHPARLPLARYAMLMPHAYAMRHIVCHVAATLITR